VFPNLFQFFDLADIGEKVFCYLEKIDLLSLSRTCKVLSVSDILWRVILDRKLIATEDAALRSVLHEYAESMRYPPNKPFFVKALSGVGLLSTPQNLGMHTACVAAHKLEYELQALDPSTKRTCRPQDFASYKRLELDRAFYTKYSRVFQLLPYITFCLFTMIYIFQQPISVLPLILSVIFYLLLCSVVYFDYSVVCNYNGIPFDKIKTVVQSVSLIVSVLIGLMPWEILFTFIGVKTMFRAILPGTMYFDIWWVLTAFLFTFACGLVSYFRYRFNYIYDNVEDSKKVFLDLFYYCNWSFSLQLMFLTVKTWVVDMSWWITFSPFIFFNLIILLACIFIVYKKQSSSDPFANSQIGYISGGLTIGFLSLCLLDAFMIGWILPLLKLQFENYRKVALGCSLPFLLLEISVIVYWFKKT